MILWGIESKHFISPRITLLFRSNPRWALYIWATADWTEFIGLIKPWLQTVNSFSHIAKRMTSRAFCTILSPLSLTCPFFQPLLPAHPLPLPFGLPAQGKVLAIGISFLGAYITLLNSNKPDLIKSAVLRNQGQLRPSNLRSRKRGGLPLISS